MSDPNRIEVWLDETSDPSEPVWCVSLCASDGEEIKCLSTEDDHDEAILVGKEEASIRELTCVERNTDGSIDEVA